jgi:pimeloyl-ACP methyl ester carboxylesterase
MNWKAWLVSLPLMTISLSFAAPSVAENLKPPIPPCEPPSAGTITYTEIVARYADADSRFVVLEGKDGIRTHFKDQGSGPAILLVHSSIGDLNDWDGWVGTLAKDYRVVRLDLPAFGLTGPVPSGNYSVDRYLLLVDSLMDHLGIERFAIAGSSYGGLVAFRYAGTRTDRVTALILQNSAGIEYGGHGGTAERDRDVEATFKPKRATRDMLSQSLKTVINDPSRVTPELVARKTDFANVIGRDWESFIATRLYERGNPERVLGHVRAPTLVMWGGSSKALSVSTAQAFVDALSHAKAVKKIIYEGGGHLLHIERPEQTATDVKDFLDQYLGDKE